MNDQESYWSSTHGNDYTDRNHGQVLNNIFMLNRALVETDFPKINSVVELGANRGEMMEALQNVLGPEVEYHAVEINRYAAEKLEDLGVNVSVCSVFDWEPEGKFDLVVTRGFLIHITPDRLPEVYEKIKRACARYVLVCEYYAPKSEMIPYHGVKNLLWRGDFAGSLCVNYGFRLVDYGFIYHRDERPQDDVTYFLLEVGDAA